MIAMSETRKVAEWSERPFTDHGSRRTTVHHRIIVDVFPGVGVDIRHEIKCDDRDIPDWITATAWEARDHGVQRVEKADQWWVSPC